MQTSSIKRIPCCHTYRGPPGCIWILSCWLGSVLSLCPNCPESHWRQRVQWVWDIPRCSWCISCSSFSNTAMWWCTRGRLTTWGRWRCWHTDACRPRCRKAYRRPSRHRLSSRRDRWSRCPCQRSEGEGWSLEQEEIADRQQVKRSKSLPVWVEVCFISTQTNWWSSFQLRWKIAVTFKSRHKTAGQQWIAHTQQQEDLLQSVHQHKGRTNYFCLWIKMQNRN